MHRNEKDGPSVVRHNKKRDWLERVVELHEMLQGRLPEGITIKPPKLSANQAFSVIYFLQEMTEIIPDAFELCSVCKQIFDSDAEGICDGKHYCDNCRPAEGR